MLELVELEIIYFDVILCMEWHHACYVSVDCRTLVVKFQYYNERFLKWKIR